MHLRLREVFLIGTLLLPVVARGEAPPQPGQLANQPPAVVSQPGQLADTLSAPPLSVKEKFNYNIIQTFGLKGVAGALTGGAFSQITGTPHDWGGGMHGYGLRVVSSYGGTITRQGMAFVLESELHEDPRYFPSTEKSFVPRTINAIKQSVLSKNDQGRTTVAYGSIISAFAAGQLVSAWQPASNGKVTDGLERGVISLGVDAGYNFLQEFFPFLRPPSLRHRH